MKQIKKIVKDFFLKSFGKHFNVSFSRTGDDLQLMKLINNANPGVYVDIGSWHPIKASNTYYFYLRNWRGICIDPNPDLSSTYKKLRPKDTFVNAGIGNSKEELDYFIFQESSMNTFSQDFINTNHLQSKIIKQLKVPMFSLKEVLDANLKNTDRLDFFDIDVEGFDLEVLKTNDWQKYRPKVIMVESGVNIKNDITSEIVSYLETKDYKLIGKTIIYGDLGNVFLISN
jgi:FkbM family methyltransferase